MKAVIQVWFACACAPCLAQSPTTLMPEGSRDVSVGVMFISMPAIEGSRKRNRGIIPLVRARWSNGAFINNLSAGIQLSPTPHLRYGPLVAAGGNEAREPGERDERRLLVGAFAGYSLLHNLSVDALALHGGARGGGGNTLQLTARTWMALAPHHGASLELGVDFADGRYMDSHFGATARAGVKDTFVGAGWNWQASRKYDLYTGVKFTRLSDNAGTGRFVATRGGAQLVSSFAYSF